MTIAPDRLAVLDTTVLTVGKHTSPKDGMCWAELVAYIAGEPHSDHPTCTSSVLADMGRKLNDSLPDDKRQRLVPLTVEAVGTAVDGHDQARGLLAMDWLIRVYTPTWLRLAGLEAEAVSLEGLPTIVSWGDVEAAVPVIKAAEVQAKVASSAANSAASSAASSVASSAAYSVAAHSAAYSAASSAAYSVASSAASSAAHSAAYSVAHSVASSAAYSVAYSAATSALAPTVDTLQDSAIELLARMVAA